jgi:DnaJ-class molecular chaperone
MTDIAEDEDACPRCHGEGTIPCETCRGRGGRNVNRLRPSSFDYREGTEGLQWETCTTCDGSRREVCPECFGGHLD